MADYSLDALHCDKCALQQSLSSCNDDTDNNCLWIPKNNELDGECSHKCKARLTKGECGQYHEWNKTSLSPDIYDFSGNDNACIWHPNEYAMDDTHNSNEGVCRAKDSQCFDSQVSAEDAEAAEAAGLSQIGEVYCGYYYGGHNKDCYNRFPPDCGSGCENYKDPRIYDLPSNADKGICVSDGNVTYDLETGENMGPLMSDGDCGDIKSVEDCMNYHGYGCLWEPFNEYCIPTVPQPNDGVTIGEMFNSCKPVDGHLPGDYDVNMLEEENINVSEYRDRNNKKHPYFTSKYLCDVCHIRDNDLDNMNKLSSGGDADPEKLKYYMIKKYVNFDDGNNNRSSTISVTPQQYCEKEIDDTHDIFNPCIWDSDNTATGKGGKCISKCSQHSPVDNSVTNSQELKHHKDQCVSDKWFPEDSVRDIQFPNLLRDSETDDDYFNDRYCTWDGFECHNSIPCKFAQQTRCEDLGYEWYEGTALDIMNQGNGNGTGIPLDLSSSYPIERKGDGKPVEGDMEGICVYPNIEAGFVGQPADYIINPQYIGEQVIMIKWREYGSGWWVDMSCKRKMEGLTIDMIDDTVDDSYFLGENVALVPFTIEQGDKCEDIKTSINNALQNYQYFVYNGEWVMYAEDLIHAIERSYDSSIDEGSMSDSGIDKYKKCYGYKYYSNTQSLDELPGVSDIHDRKILNTLYDLRGTVNLLPVVNQHCVLEISAFNINSNSGKMSFTFHRPPEINNNTENINSNFQFVEFFGTEIFKEADTVDTLSLTVLSRYNYPLATAGPGLGQLPNNIVKGYGTLYENNSVNNIFTRVPTYVSTYVATPVATPGDDWVASGVKTFDIRIQDEFNELQSLINGLKTIYTEDELKAWAPYNEFKNFNVFTQPVITIKDELHKAECTRGSRAQQLCSGSIESWKYLIGDTAPPTYQTLDLMNVDGLLRLMARYFSDTPETASSGFPDIITKKDNIQPTTDPLGSLTDTADITKAALWSITRNTPPFWGNLFYNRGYLGGVNNYYLSSGNFNIINTNDPATLAQSTPQSTPEYAQYYGIRLPFNVEIAGNTLIKPFCEAEDESSQHILWKNIMSYTGGNKREIQLSRNVRNIDYNNYVSQLDPTLSSGRNYTGEGYSGSDIYYMGLPYSELLTTISGLNTGYLQNAKREYIYRSLSDWLRLEYKELHPYCNGPGDDTTKIKYGPSTRDGGALTAPDQWDEDPFKRRWLSTRPDDSGTGPRLVNISHDYHDSTLDTQHRLLNGSGWNDASGDSPIDRLVKDSKKTSYTTDSTARSYCAHDTSDNTNFSGFKNSLIGNSTTNCPASSANCRFTANEETTISIGKIGGGGFIGVGETAIKQVANAGGNLPTSLYGGYPGYTYWSYIVDQKRFNPNKTGALASSHKDMLSSETCGGTYNYDMVKGDATGINQYISNAYDNGTWEGDQTTSGALDPQKVDWTVRYGTYADESARGRDGNVSGIDICCGAWLKPDCTTRLGVGAINLPGYKNNGTVDTGGTETGYSKRAHLFPGISNTGLGDIPATGPNLDSPDILYSDTDHNILSLHRLSRTPITEHEDVLKQGDTWINDSSSTENLLYPWGKKYSGVGDENTMWSEFITNEYNNHPSMINQLYYPLDTDDTSDITKPNGNPRDEKDKLRAWCMSTSSSLNDNFKIDTGTFNKLNHINPDNDENQVGIIGYDGSLSVDLLDDYLGNNNLDPLANTEFFDMEKETNAYKYPEICESWYLKNRTGDRDKLAKYDYTMNTWSNQDYDPLTSDFSTDFDTITGNTITANTLMGMIYPLSITSARPREKVIYVDITPNNDMFNKGNPINIYYFPNTLENTTTISQSILDIPDSKSASDSVITAGDLVITDGDQSALGYNNSILNKYDNDSTKDYSKYFWLSPGIGSPPTDTESHVSIIGINEDGDFTTSGTTPSSQRANYQVAYFKFVHELSSGADAKLSKTNDIYKFTGSMLSLNLVANDPLTAPPNDILSISSLGPSINSIFFKGYGTDDATTDTLKNKLLYPADYYNSRMPPSTAMTIIDKELFGTGKPETSTGQTTVPLAQVTPSPIADIADYFQITGTPQNKYFNINMVFGEGNNDLEVDQNNICRDLIRSKLSECGNPNRWSSPNKTGCITCFDIDNDINRGLCSSYPDLIQGTVPDLVIQDGVTDLSDPNLPTKLGVCGILQSNNQNKTPWDYIDVTHEPDDFGQNLPPQSPYDLANRDCDMLDQSIDIQFLPIHHSDTDHVFFKPASSNSSDIFYSETNDGKSPYACVRKDLSLINKDNIKLSCNTNLSTPIERDKHVLINFIIEHTDDLDASKRTKLAIMSEEELLNKALSLNIDIESVNEYTRPMLYKKVNDIYNPNICERSNDYCDNDIDCGENGPCGRYEEWNDLQKYYYNIDNEGPLSKDYTMRKGWTPVGCGIDLNYSDSTSAESSCKDKYPGLCEKNIEKCTSENKELREAIMLDCPETCQVQYTDFDRYKNEQIGELSICTARGRCKWSHDDDPSNLLPLCEDHTTRSLGSTEMCGNYNLSPILGGPDAGTCNLRDYPDTLSSPVCAEQRCTSMEGCVFTKQKSRYCKVESAVNEMIINEVDCPKGGRWIGPSTGGQCIMSEQDLYEGDLQDFEQDCNILGGTIVEGQEQSCEYIPDIPYVGEDPCSHTVDLDELTADEMSNYFFEAISKITVDSITPETLDGASKTKTHPNYITITLNGILNDTNINDHSNINNLTTYPNNKYIYIDNNTSNINSLCSQYLIGKSKIIKYEDTGGKTNITIGGPNKAYILPRTTDGSIDFGGDACEVNGIYDIENYYVNSGDVTGATGGTSEIRKSNACYNNPKGACNYEQSGDCVSCSLYKDEVSCFGNNDPEEYSRCGWGSIKDMCGVIGEIDECKKMHLDGCEWDPATETCSLNKLTDDDGNPLVDKVGCVKCSEIDHRNTCNSMKNCFWDALTNTDGDNIGECRACSSIDDPNNDINADNLTTDKASRCDEFQLTEGQCEFRNPNNKVSGLDSEFKIGLGTGYIDFSTISSQAESSWNVIWDSIFGDGSKLIDDNIKDSECSVNSDNCKCSPTRLYPFFPDWIIHNLVFFVVFAPFMAYFGYAWYKVLLSPAVFESKLVEIGEGTNNYSKGDMWSSFKKSAKSIKDTVSPPTASAGVSPPTASAGVSDASADALSDAINTILREVNKSTGGAEIGTRYATEGAKAEFNPYEEVEALFSGVNLSLNINGKLLTFDTKGFFGGIFDIYLGDFNPKASFKSIFNPILFGGSWGDRIRLQFDNFVPSTNKDTRLWCAPMRDGRNLKSLTDYLHFLLYIPFLFINPIWFFKIIFMFVSLPFTILQFLTYNVRLSIPKRLTGLCTLIADAIITKIAPAAMTGLSAAPGVGVLLGPFFSGIFVLIGCIIYLLTPAVLLGVAIYLAKVGLDILLDLTKAGVSPNPNYVDPVDGVTHNQAGKIYQASAVWPRRLYREEWDDMIKDPLADAVIQQRESLLPEILQGDPDNESNVLDAYKIAYMEVEPESLNWTQSLRDIGSYYNKFVNRLGDNFLFTFILAPYIIYKYITSVSDYFPVKDEPFQFKDVLVYTVLYAVIFGLVSVIMTRSEATADEYDGVETKCYGDIASPFTMGSGDPINYPKLCYGESIDEDKKECPYGCYYIGDGSTNPKKCKDNRSGLSLGGILEPEPRLNIPSDANGAIPDNWFRPDEPDKEYVCPPKSIFLDKYPYDALCSTTAKRCKSRNEYNNLTIDGDDYCETLYMKNNYNDNSCISNFSDPTERYENSDFVNSARGPVTDKNDIEINCELHLPQEGYKKDKFCPFPLPAAESDFYSEETDTRSSIELWNLAYDKIRNPGNNESCTYLCENPSNCSLNENTYKDVCGNIDMSTGDPENICGGTTLPDGSTCDYFPENIPLQQSIQNQERYLIVNQDYGGNLFS